ncbi:DUF6920 family protein [Kordia sp.]|uniref:DUF6920 family protein n=1 Tax=Kordia sp. TaxID=1965332 RepID=UPI003D6AA656
MRYSKTKYILTCIGFIVCLLCQILIILFWENTKYWTILNLIIFLVVTLAYAAYRFFEMTHAESKKIMQFPSNMGVSLVTVKAISHLPLSVQKWLRKSQVIDKHHLHFVQLKQKGEMRTKPNAPWMPFIANQYFNTIETSFVWIANVTMFPFIQLYGCDKLIKGKGAMLIKLAALMAVVKVKETDKINSAAMIRYLAEICWFPTAALHPSIVWEAINATSAKATFTIKNRTVSGIFNFSEEGEIMSFEAERFYGNTTDATLEKWHVEIVSHKEFNGIRIPNKSHVIWKLKEGDFHWLTVEITDINYNTTKMN